MRSDAVCRSTPVPEVTTDTGECLVKNIYIQGTHKRMVRFQKLTRNLFLTLHGHNLHRQQRQLSKFIMRYQQFTSHAYCGASFQDGVAAGKRSLCAPF